MNTGRVDEVSKTNNPAMWCDIVTPIHTRWDEWVSGRGVGNPIASCPEVHEGTYEERVSESGGRKFLGASQQLRKVAHNSLARHVAK